MATAFTNLTTEWKEISSGPTTIQVTGGKLVLINIGSSAPDNNDTKNCFKIVNLFTYTGSEKIYARFVTSSNDPSDGLVVDTIS